jgi:hypothetical protein
MTAAMSGHSRNRYSITPPARNGSTYAISLGTMEHDDA